MGQANIQSGVKRITVEKNQSSKYSDCLAVITDSERNKFIAVYSDNMVFIWDYTDIKKA